MGLSWLKIALLSASCAASASAREYPKMLRFTGAFSPFPFSDFADQSAAFTASVNAFPKTLLSLRILGESEDACEKCREFPRGSKMLHDLTEYSLLAGWSGDGLRYGVSASAGPAYDFGKEKSHDAMGGIVYREYRVLGLALDARASLMFNRAFGIGIQGFANLNPRQSLFGLMGALELRWL